MSRITENNTIEELQTPALDTRAKHPETVEILSLPDTIKTLHDADIRIIPPTVDEIIEEGDEFNADLSFDSNEMHPKRVVIALIQCFVK
ncbi:hypothetical protein ABW19_dt0206177 [Dactylella cylindrospora]|nr:hypothetical protein ABW19_dt0206177 [Dactylella cylindrospora]